MPSDLESRRFAEIGAVLARAVGADELEASYAIAVLKQLLRKRNTNRRMLVPYRSVAAHEILEADMAGGPKAPQNGSRTAIHCDHVWSLQPDDLRRMQTSDVWLGELPRLDEVVCVTADENYSLQRIERAGTTGWGKYEVAGIKLIRVTTAEVPPHLVAEADFEEFESNYGVPAVEPDLGDPPIS